MTSRAKTPCPGSGCTPPRITWGWRSHLEEVPEFRCTINLVPSLLAQLEAYASGATDTHLSCSSRPADGLDARGSLLPARQFFHGQSGHDDPAAPALSRALSAALGVEQLGPRSTLSVSHPRPARPSGLVQPGLDPPSALRAGDRSRRIQSQGPPLHRRREAMVPGQAARAGGPRHSAASRSWPRGARSS